MEDNQACQRIIEVGRSDKMGHIKRTHKVNIAALHERLVAKDFTIQYINTEYQCADPFTKAITCKETWARSLTNINMFKLKDIWGGRQPTIVNTANSIEHVTTVAAVSSNVHQQQRQFCARQTCLQANRTGISGAYCSDRCKVINETEQLNERRNNRQQQHFHTIPTFPALFNEYMFGFRLHRYLFGS